MNSKQTTTQTNGTAMINTIRQSFFQYGWLLPAYFPVAEVTGRAVFSIVSGIYLLWALIGLRVSSIKADRVFVALYAGLLISLLLSLTQALDPARGAEDWLKYLFRSMTFFFTLLVLRSNPENPDRLLKALGLSGLLMMGVLLLELIHAASGPDFNPRLQLNEHNVPWLAPLMVFALYFLLPGLRKYRLVTASLAVLVATAYVLLSQGRAALLAMIVAAVVLAHFGYRIRWRYIVAIPIVLLAVAVAIEPSFMRGISLDNGIWEILDKFTSGRTVLWRNAIQYPPENPILGVGLSNAHLYTEVMRISATATVKHLHNFLFDAWYETGLLGLAFLLAILGYGMATAIKAAAGKQGNERMAIVFLMASVAAILTEGFFGVSYTSKPFTIYLYLIFALFFTYRQSPAAHTDPAFDAPPGSSKHD